MQGFRRPVALLLGAALAALPVADAAAQTTALALDAQAGVGYSTNPFLVRGDDDTGSVSTELSIQPQLLWRDELGDAALIARYRRSDYLTRYDPAEAYGLEAQARRQLSQTVNARANIAYDSSIIGQGGFGVVGVVDPTPQPDLSTPDIALLGLGQRQRSLVAGVGGDWRMTQRDSLNTDLRINRVNYGGNSLLLTSSRTSSATLGYSRAISERTSVGVQGSGSWTEFDRNGYNGSFYQPQATLSHQVNDRLHFTAALGAVFISSTTERGTTKVTGVSGSFEGCRDYDRSVACARAASDAQATGLGDISRRYSASADYSYRLRENDVLRATVDYSRIKETSNLPQLSDVGFLTAGASYDRGLSPRLFVGASAGYRYATGGQLDRPSDLNFRLYIRTRLGGFR